MSDLGLVLLPAGRWGAERSPVLSLACPRRLSAIPHRRYDPDSGHDSGAEDTTVEAPPPYAFLTIGMGKILLSHGSALTARDPNGCTVPLPPRIGVCLDYEQGKVSFYDAVSFRELWECGVDCSGPVCPAFCFIGGGALHLQELVANKQERKVTIGGFAKLD